MYACIYFILTHSRNNTPEHSDRWPMLRQLALPALQCVALCCSVLQRVAMRCGVLQSVVCHGDVLTLVCVLQCAAMCCGVLQCFAVCCSVCCSVCGSVLQCVAIGGVSLGGAHFGMYVAVCQKTLVSPHYYNTLQHAAVRCIVLQCVVLVLSVC